MSAMRDLLYDLQRMQSEERIGQQELMEADDNSIQSTTGFFPPRQQPHNARNYPGRQQPDNTRASPWRQMNNQNRVLGPLHVDVTDTNTWLQPIDQWNSFLERSPPALLPCVFPPAWEPRFSESSPHAMQKDGEVPDPPQNSATSTNPRQPSSDAIQHSTEDLVVITKQQEVIRKLQKFQMSKFRNAAPRHRLDSANHPVNRHLSYSVNPQPERYFPDSFNQFACRPDFEKRHSKHVSHNPGRLRANPANYHFRFPSDPIHYHANSQKPNFSHPHTYIQQQYLKNDVNRGQVNIRTKYVAHKANQQHPASQIQLDYNKNPVKHKKTHRSNSADDSRMKIRQFREVGMQTQRSARKNAKQQTNYIGCHDVGQQTENPIGYKAEQDADNPVGYNVKQQADNALCYVKQQVDNAVCYLKQQVDNAVCYMMQRVDNAVRHLNQVVDNPYNNMEQQIDKPACHNLARHTESSACYNPGKQSENPVCHDTENPACHDAGHQTVDPACIDSGNIKENTKARWKKNKIKHIKNKNPSFVLQSEDTTGKDDQLEDLTHQYERQTLEDFQHPTEAQKLSDDPLCQRKGFPSKDPLPLVKNQQPEGHWTPREDPHAGDPLCPKNADPFQLREERLKSTSHPKKEPQKNGDPSRN